MGCNEGGKNAVPASENDVDAARNFINAALDGHYDEAREMIVPDSANNAWIDLFKRNYQSRMTMADKAGYRDASINIHSVAQPNDSTSVVHYSHAHQSAEHAGCQPDHDEQNYNLCIHNLFLH